VIVIAVPDLDPAVAGDHARDVIHRAVFIDVH
jgi:hypothetical protein